MKEAVSISGKKYTVAGFVRNRTNKKGIPGLNVLVYDKDLIGKDDFLDTTTTDALGRFIATFDHSDFSGNIFDKKPDLYFIVKDGDKVLLNTKDNVIKKADESTPAITLWVDDFDSKAPGNGSVPALGWVGGFVDTNKAFAYPDPDLSSLGPLKGNMDNIKLLQRQQKVLWPEFSWNTIVGDESSRAYQMFAPDISRLGYTNEGRVYSIICPQQGTCSSKIGCLNVEVTVTGNRGWVDEDINNKAIAADMEVVGKVWFSPGAKQNRLVKAIWEKFANSPHPYPSNKDNAIQITTYKPDCRPETIFPLRKGQSTDFPIPEFAQHSDAWDVAHLGVEIGGIVLTGVEEVDKFNQTIMNIFNIVSGNMLADGNVLTWNVWFIAPQHVNQTEWKNHAEKWRKSINADHGSPLGPGTSAKYFDGSAFHPLASFLKEEEELVLELEKKHL